MKFLLILLAAALTLTAQPAAIANKIKALRSLPDADRPAVTTGIALEIRKLPPSAEKQTLAIHLASLVTEGDPGYDTLQQVANTLAESLREQPSATDDPYSTLAQLVRYEHVEVSLDAPAYFKAMKQLETDDRHRDQLDFTLAALDGRQYTLKQLKGKVVLVNFWATWCPPCRKEMPDLDAIYAEFRDKGLVILAITDEERPKVETFLAGHKVQYPILLDPGRKVNDLFVVHGIPKTFIYDRSGHLAAESIDMRTRGQFLALLSRAGLMTQHAKGIFTVDVHPLTPAPAEGVSRYSIDKQIHGDLEATTKGEMFSAGDPQQGAAGYVAIEVVSGTLNGKKGTFALQHSATMDQTGRKMSVAIVPGSGTGELKGIAGTFEIVIEQGKHSYDLAYTLP